MVAPFNHMVIQQTLRLADAARRLGGSTGDPGLVATLGGGMLHTSSVKTGPVGSDGGGSLGGGLLA